eukprot:CAMPEP_0174383646 /NCGR_PEP_ID=MMETSP0811_2-20130205/125382_1 /TAXON_ID=73025 ORGANISM="Eutreptiella gymnastica-like, Strain CCMP1594" /NCGR_SAMPLE_ID=MMETSP0811_2 /ASSEMBLY_ACC=CAM_ASM_000667 /LENGTH=59 /DNA_ID=CAMNT_0015537325 /DNA_START=477 /DNA_END=656 /DNA_ORIENTATION=+
MTEKARSSALSCTEPASCTVSVSSQYLESHQSQSCEPSVIMVVNVIPQQTGGTEHGPGH